jgi:hypothetical protein
MSEAPLYGRTKRKQQSQFTASGEINKSWRLSAIKMHTYLATSSDVCMHEEYRNLWDVPSRIVQLRHMHAAETDNVHTNALRQRDQAPTASAER